MLEALLVFALWPWVSFIAAIGILLFFTYYDSTISVLIATCVLLAINWRVYDQNPFLWIYNNPKWTLYAFASYIAVGVIWSIIKWNKRMSSEYVQERMKGAKQRFEKIKSQGEESDRDRRYEKEIKSGEIPNYQSSPFFPYAAILSRNKDAIISWISLWPFSMFLYVFAELLIDFFEMLYRFFSSVYEAISRRHMP